MTDAARRMVIVTVSVSELVDGKEVNHSHQRVSGERFDFQRVVDELNHVLNGGEMFPHKAAPTPPEPTRPPCTCGHDYDRHIDPGDKRGLGCEQCHCTLYRPLGGDA